MNKEQLLNLVDSLKLPKTDYAILSSGVLLLYGLREKAGDLDLCVSSKAFEILKERFNLDENAKNEFGFYKITEDIEIVVNDNFEKAFYEGYPVQPLENILQYKKQRLATKDLPDIAAIETYLSENK